jgi:hypothetical protein
MKRNYLQKYWLLMMVFGVALASGCQKVIDLELKNTEPIIVIEANVTNVLEPQVVKITNTYNFDEPNRFNGIANAKVELSVSNGQKVIYNATGTPGVYQSRAYQGRSGRTYTIDVTIGDKIYSATSTMPAAVPLDSVTFKQFTAFGETNTYLSLNYTDPPGIQNQYRYILKVKNKIEETTVTEDRFYDGNKTSDILFYEIDKLPAETSIDIDFQCIDRNVFKYFFAINQISGAGGPPVAPANPVSNFSNGALGIFSAHTTTKRNIVLK